MTGHPEILQTVIDTTDVRATAEFYRELFGLTYRPGDEPPPDGGPEEIDWLVLRDAAGVNKLAFQYAERVTPTTWPDPDVPMQLHLDCTVASVEELHRHRERAEALGARLVSDRSDDPDEPLFVLADPAGHPFCIFVP